MARSGSADNAGAPNAVASAPTRMHLLPDGPPKALDPGRSHRQEWVGDGGRSAGAARGGSGAPAARRSAPLTAIHVLADFASGLAYAALPEGVRHQARLCLLDTLGCMIAGSTAPEVERLAAAEGVGDGGGRSTLVGRGGRATAGAAARINGYAGDIFEINDLIGGHASIGNVSAALAVAEEVGASGSELLVALAAGIEVTARLYASFYPHLKSYEECGLVSVGVPSTVGAAAAAALLLRLRPDETRHALAIGASLAGWCPAEVIFGEGGTVKPLLFGSWPASVGIRAARYARGGLGGPPAILESRIGYFATTATRYEADALSPETWFIERPRRKLHACCGYIHSALDAAIRLRRTGRAGGPGSAITVGLPAYVLPAVAKSGPPRTGNEARFHLQYCLALALTGADAIAPDHSIDVAAHVARPEVAETMARIGVEADPALSHYHQARVAIGQPDGSTAVEDNAAPKGSPANPMSDDEVRAKFLALASPVLGTAAAEAARDAVRALGRTQDGVAGLMLALSPPPRRVAADRPWGGAADALAERSSIGA